MRQQLERSEAMGERTHGTDRHPPRPGLPVAVPHDPWRRAESLFVAWQQGDDRALDELIRLLSPILWHVVRAYDLDRFTAEDVVQVTWLALIRNGGQIRDPRAVGGWLTICARREAWRARRADGGWHPTEDAAIERRLGGSDSAEQSALADHERHRLWLAVGTLPPRCQRLLRVIAFSERPDYARLAAQLGMPVGSIGPTRGRCLEKLRRLMGDGAVSPTGVDDG